MALNSDALALAAKINKAQGAGTMSIASTMTHYGRLTSGSIALDVILGGGWPQNQWVEILGPESNGKTAVVLKTIAANQALDQDFAVLWVASEHYDKDQAEALGVDTTRVMVVSTNDMEAAFNTIIQGAESKAFDAIVLDSYPALIPGEEKEKPMEEVTVAAGARITGRFFRKIGPAMRRGSDTEDRPIIGFFINQFRDKIGGWSPAGTPKTSPGGNAKNYFFYARVEVRRDEWIVEARPGKGKANVGQTIKCTTIKNKSAPPRQVATLHFYFRDAPELGFFRGDYDTANEYFVYGVLYDIIGRVGTSYYTYGDRKWHGKDAFLRDLRGELDLQEELRVQILAESVKPDRERMKAA